MKIEFLMVCVFTAFVLGVYYVLTGKILYKLSYTFIRSVRFALLSAILIGGMTYYTTYHARLSEVKPIFLLVLSILLVKLVLKLDLKRSLILVVVCSLLTGVGDIIGLLLLRTFRIISSGAIKDVVHDFMAYAFGNLFNCILTAVFILVLWFFRNYFNLSKVTRSIVVTLILTFTIMVINVWIYFANVNIQSGIVVLISMIVLIGAYASYTLFQISISTKLERQGLELEQQKFYNASLDSTLDNLRRFKHGYNNNLNVLYALAKNQEHNRLMSYFDEVMEMNSRLNDTTALNIRNAGLYGVVASKIQYAEEKGVTFKIHTGSEVKDIPHIRMVELYEIMGIFLDNAIEASAASGEKIVYLDIMEDDQCIDIKVKNSCQQIPDLSKIYDKGFSTKDTGRGLGLWIVKEILEKNKNVLNNTYIEDTLFCQELIIRKV